MMTTPPTLEEHELPALMERLKAGDKSAAQSLVLGFTRNTQRIARNMQKRTRAPLDILESEALYFLVKAVDIAKSRDQIMNIGAWLVTYVRLELLKFCYKNHYIKSTREKFKSLGLIWKPLMSSLDMGDTISAEKNDFFIDHKEINRRKLRELLDAIEEVVDTDTDRLILSLRLKGYTDEEMSQRIGLGRSRVRQLRNKLETKLREALT